MKLLTRLQNIWRLGGQEVTQIGITPEGRPFHAFGEPTIEKPKPQMAKIIKRKMSIDEEVNEILGEKKEYE
jgi:hypothetical protein